MKNKMKNKDKMNDKERQERIKKAEYFMQPGQFQRAVGMYESLGMKKEAKIASLACAADFLLNVNGYGVAIEYFKKGGRKDIADIVSKVCEDSGFTPNAKSEMYPCNPHCSNYVSNERTIGKLIQNAEYLSEHCKSPIITDIANQAKSLKQYLLDRLCHN